MLRRAKHLFLNKQPSCKLVILIILLTQLLFMLSGMFIISPPSDSDNLDKKLVTKNLRPLEIQSKPKKSGQSDLRQHLLNVLFTDDRQNDYFKLYKPDLLLAHEDKVVLKELRHLKPPGSVYKILEYTKIGNGHKFCKMGFPGKPDSGLPRFTFLDDCEYKNCEFTCDKSLLNEADALLMHLTDVNQELLAQPDALKKLTSQRRADQPWILWNDEANSVKSGFDIMRFNWTMSYKSVSEASYGAYGLYGPHFEEQKNLSEFELFVQKNFDRRSDGSVWFVSNCASDFRNRLAVGLSMHSRVTIFGKCNRMLTKLRKSIDPKSFIESDFFNSSSFARDSEPEKSVLQNKKFSLAFENQNCSDYITEKFWRSLSFDIIPVVIQPSRSNYERIAPPNSFIHAGDFDFDPELLAVYLKEVANDIELYRKFFEWKQFTRPLFKARQVESARLCELCYRMNTHESVGFYSSVSKFFNRDCKKK